MKKHKHTLHCLVLLKRLYKNDLRLANNVQNSVKNIRRFLNGKKKDWKMGRCSNKKHLSRSSKRFFCKECKNNRFTTFLGEFMITENGFYKNGRFYHFDDIHLINTKKNDPDYDSAVVYFKNFDFLFLSCQYEQDLTNALREYHKAKNKKPKTFLQKLMEWLAK